MADNSSADPNPSHVANPDHDTAPAPSPSPSSDETRKRALEADSAPQKKSRWGNKVSLPAAIHSAADTSTITQQLTRPIQMPIQNLMQMPMQQPQLQLQPMSADQLEQFQLQSRIAILSQLLASPDSSAIPAYFSNRPRSPSPDPVYDPITGQRSNTREQRQRKKVETERNELTLRGLSLNPQFKTPPGWKRPTAMSFQLKIFVPVDSHPNYNFRGQIIGPRGSTQQKLERELNCKIAIRGKGSIPEGKSQRSNGPSALSANEPLHVLLSADTQEKLDKAESVIAKLLIPKDDRLNEHKTQQLRELALYNGTLRDEIICRKCNKSGHKMFDCPLRESTWKPADVSCEYCGSTGHPSQDCTQKGENRRDEELERFIQELRGEESIRSGTQKSHTQLAIEGTSDTGDPNNSQQQQQQSSQSHLQSQPQQTQSQPPKLFIHPARQIHSNNDPANSSNQNYNRNQNNFGGRRIQTVEGRDAAREFRPNSNTHNNNNSNTNYDRNQQNRNRNQSEYNYQNNYDGGRNPTYPQSIQQPAYQTPQQQPQPFYINSIRSAPMSSPAVPIHYNSNIVHYQSQSPSHPHNSSYQSSASLQSPSPSSYPVNQYQNQNYPTSQYSMPMTIPVQFDPSKPPPPLPTINNTSTLNTQQVYQQNQNQPSAVVYQNSSQPPSHTQSQISPAYPNSNANPNSNPNHYP